MKIDPNTEFGAHVLKRLSDEQVIWLTTVRPDGIPQPNPVWFLWDGENVLILSQSSAKKVSHIRTNPKVALNFNSTLDGGDVVIITGVATIDANPLTASERAGYLEKYRQGLIDINMTSENFEPAYSTIIRVTPSHMRGF